MNGSSSDSRGSGADALDCEAMARIWRGVRAAAPSTGGESEEEDREERGNREGVFLFFFALGVNIHIIFFQGYTVILYMTLGAKTPAKSR